jgi:hypothetical protein
MARTPDERARDEQRVQQALLGELLPPHDRRIHCKVVGVMSDNEDGSSRQQAIDRMAQFDFGELVRDPESDYDHNEIEVWATVAPIPTARPAPGETTVRVKIGHLHREVSCELAPAIDAGEKWQAIATRVGGFPSLGVGLMLFRRIP